jgi:hypothetical protein
MEKLKQIEKKNIIIEGFLNKRGTNLMKTFNKRYFVLTNDNILRYFKNNTPNDAIIGEFLLGGGSEIVSLNDDSNIDKVK